MKRRGQEQEEGQEEQEQGQIESIEEHRGGAEKGATAGQQMEQKE